MRAEVLDHGYVQLVEAWGSDERIVEAARMSTDKGFLGWGPKTCGDCGGDGHTRVMKQDGWLGDGKGRAGEHVIVCQRCNGTGNMPGDEKLLRFLHDNHHDTPFEMGGAVFEVQAPIFVFREWHRHRTQSYNELSARYTPLPDMFYIPSVERVMAARQSKTNKQGSEAGFSEKDAVRIRARIALACNRARAAYEEMLEEGVVREVARVVVPVGQYSRMRASSNLRNWMHFLHLRLAPNAQWEIREYAETLAGMLSVQFPRTMELFRGK